VAQSLTPSACIALSLCAPRSQRYKEAYFGHYSGGARAKDGEEEGKQESSPPKVYHRGLYVTGDLARRDSEGYFFVAGRSDDVVNVSGHRLSSGEVEGALALHAAVAEAAVVARPHPIKGEALAAFVVAKQDAAAANGDASSFLTELKSVVTKDIGKLAVPDDIFVVPGLPKTRSGKVMRRLLRLIVIGQTEAKQLGDTSTLADPQVVQQIIDVVNKNKKQSKDGQAPKSKL